MPPGKKYVTRLPAVPVNLQQGRFINAVSQVSDKYVVAVMRDAINSYMKTFGVENPGLYALVKAKLAEPYEPVAFNTGYAVPGRKRGRPKKLVAEKESEK